MILCELCEPERLCELHLAGDFACLCGVAARRGELWAASVARRCGRERPWPRTPRAHAIALAKVSDLGRDPRLVERLAEHAEHWAARWWSRPT